MTDYFDFSAFAIDSTQLAYQNQLTCTEFGVQPPTLFDTAYACGHAPSNLSASDIDQMTLLRLFAHDNNATFFGSMGGQFPDPRGAFAPVARIGSFFMTVATVIIPLDNNQWYEFGLLRFESGDRNIPDKYHVYIKRTLPMHVPNLALDATSSPLAGHVDHNYQSYETESSEFNKAFRLYIPSTNPQRALTVLTPNIMAYLTDHFNSFEIDLHDDMLFMMTPCEKLADPDIVRMLMDSADNLCEALTPAKPTPPRTPTFADVAEYCEYYGYQSYTANDRRNIVRHTTAHNIKLAVIITFSLLVIAAAVVAITYLAP